MSREPKKPTDLYKLKQPHGSDVSHVLAVGPEKPLGYMTYNDIAKEGVTPEQLRRYLEAQGKTVLELPECPYYTGTVVTPHDESVVVDKPVRFMQRGPLFYAYNEEALGKLLSTGKAKKVLEEAGWPSDPKGFVEHVHRVDVALKTPLFDLISDAFRSNMHMGRTDVRARGKHGAYYEGFRDMKPTPREALPVSTLRQGYDPEDPHTHEVMLHRAAIPADSTQHYNAQYKADRSMPTGDWLDRLEQRRTDARTNPDKGDTPNKR